MDIFTLVITLLSGVYLVFLGTAMGTNNLRSTVLFKTVPILLGIGLLLVGVKLLNWI